MCQSCLHFPMYHQQMWLLWVLFAKKKTLQTSLTHSLFFPPTGVVLSLRWPTASFNTRKHTPTDRLTDIAPHPLLLLFKKKKRKSVHRTLIFSTSCMRELFRAALFLVFALSGIHFMSKLQRVWYPESSQCSRVIRRRGNFTGLLFTSWDLSSGFNQALRNLRGNDLVWEALHKTDLGEMVFFLFLNLYVQGDDVAMPWNVVREILKRSQRTWRPAVKKCDE